MIAKLQETEDSKPDVMNSTEVADYLRMSHKNVIVQAEAKEIPGVKIGSMWRFSRKRIEALVAGA